MAADGARTVQRLFPIDNRSGENRARRYLVSPLDYLAAELAADGAGQTLLGFYHSHPEHPAEPSATDLAWAQPNFVYIIMSIRRPGAPDTGESAPAAAGAGAFLLELDPAAS